MSIASEISRINGEINSQSTIIDEITAILDSKISANPSLQEKTVTPNTVQQEVTPDTEYDGLSKVTVNGDNNLLPENIKEGVSIFGILGVLPSVDIMYKEAVSELYTDGSDYEIINLKSLPYLPLIILIIKGENITDLPNILGANECAIYVRHGDYSKDYAGLVNDEHYGSLDTVYDFSFIKKTDGTYDLDGIRVWKFYMPADNNDVGNKYTAILIGRAAEEF